MQRFVLIALLAVVCVASAHNDIYIGQKTSGEELLEQKKIDVDSKLLRVVEHQESFFTKGHYVISRVEIIDYKNKDTSAKPQIMSGGIGHSHLIVNFVSQRSHGIHFIVKVYGRRSYN